jgi:hypothetical protein
MLVEREIPADFDVVPGWCGSVQNPPTGDPYHTLQDPVEA